MERAHENQIVTDSKTKGLQGGGGGIQFKEHSQDLFKKHILNMFRVIFFISSICTCVNAGKIKQKNDI